MQEHKRRMGRALRGLGIAACLACALAAVYYVGRLYFATHYLPGTTVFALDASYLTEGELSGRLESFVNGYELHVTDGSFELEVAGSDVKCSCDAPGIARRALEAQDVDAWPVCLVGGTVVETELSFDAKALEGLVGEAVASYDEKAVLPVPAKLVLDAGRTRYSLVDEREGTALDATRVQEKVSQAMVRGLTYVGLDQEDLVQPAYRAESAEAQEALARANGVFDLRLDLMREGKRACTLDADVFGKWLTATEELTPGIDMESLCAWAQTDLWPSVDYADDVAVHVVDVEKLGARIAKRIEAISDNPIEVPYVLTPRYLPSGGGLAGTWNAQDGRYVEVDKGRQVAVLYDGEGRVLWESPITTGNEATGDGTPAGVFCVYDMQTDFVLIGHDNDGDGRPDYEHHVDFWMPFNASIGFHDASWRDVYGGTEYQEHGSGGCVNLPHEAADALYHITHVGEVVVVHE